MGLQGEGARGPSCPETEQEATSLTPVPVTLPSPRWPS